MKKIRRILVVLHYFVGIGAIFGGSVAILFPEKPFGISVDALKNSPFANYLIPGLILFSVIGLGNIICAVLFRRQLKFQGYISSIFSWALVFWIVIQCIMIRSIAPPHVIYFILGLVEAGLSFLLLIEKRLFPANLVICILEKMKIKFNNQPQG